MEIQEFVAAKKSYQQQKKYFATFKTETMENILDIPKKASLFKWLKIEKEQICYLNISLASCKVNHQASKKSLTMRQNTTELVLLHKL